MFRAARSRWTYPISERYLIPAAMPRSIPTNWMTVNWPSCFCAAQRKNRQVSRVHWPWGKCRSWYSSSYSTRFMVFMCCTDPVAICLLSGTLSSQCTEKFWKGCCSEPPVLGRWHLPWGKHLMSRSPCTRWQSSLVFLENKKKLTKKKFNWYLIYVSLHSALQ